MANFSLYLPGNSEIWVLFSDLFQREQIPREGRDPAKVTQQEALFLSPESVAGLWPGRRGMERAPRLLIFLCLFSQHLPINHFDTPTRGAQIESTSPPWVSRSQAPALRLSLWFLALDSGYPGLGSKCWARNTRGVVFFPGLGRGSGERRGPSGPGDLATR